ncbi:carboxymuconolactone decarboxylase family protein [Streptomyces sp. ACA25]|uniref:carboxymuconolactone decarboxylase family protein n=1 Tax=Streptomyces sp. ACA25 TaxID=3022596 RepID=UPI0023077744|nr:carboxymuconolactone decarboxylase family protein [Streptomyces sp. ACA25]MDB1086312.1 carboxymuconolactone decarboxylase family protein [Streptomyces sp. ACA25]
MARISLTPPRTPLLRLLEWYSRRSYGKVLDVGLVLGHHPRILRGVFGFENKVSRWNELDPELKHLAVMATAAKINCSWCLDFGHWTADQLGLSPEKVSKVPVWRKHRESFTDMEQLVMEYAEAMTESGPTVTDEQTSRLIRHLGEPAFVELTVMVALENFRSRVNSAVGLTSQGFSESCAVRPPGQAVAE